MQRRIIFSLLVLFVVFLIVNDATGAGQTANSFFDWIGSGMSSLREFLNALFGGEEAATAL